VGAHTKVARCYYYGIGTKRDVARAVKWYRKAAERGDAEAQSVLGRAFALGEGVKRDVRKAVFWYRKAASQGDKTAGRALADLGARDG
jgi:TPR repeat protein